MKTLFVLLLLVLNTAVAYELPRGVVVSFDLKGARDGALAIRPTDSVTVVLTFTNTTHRTQRFGVHEYDPFHGKLPCPLNCMARDLTIPDTFQSQYVAWSTTFPETDRRNRRKLGAGEKLTVEFPLERILQTWTGGESLGPLWSHLAGFRRGESRFLISYEDEISREFVLHVAADASVAPPTIAPASSTPSDDVQLIDYFHESDGVFYMATIGLTGGRYWTQWATQQGARRTTTNLVLTENQFRELGELQKALGEFRAAPFLSADDVQTQHVVLEYFRTNGQSGCRRLLIAADQTTPALEAWLKKLGFPYVESVLKAR